MDVFISCVCVSLVSYESNHSGVKSKIYELPDDLYLSNFPQKCSNRSRSWTPGSASHSSTFTSNKNKFQQERFSLSVEK